MSLPIVIREKRDSDTNFILNSWLLSYRTSNGFPRMSKRDYYAIHEPKFKRILSQSTVCIACPQDDADALVGYCVFREPSTLHWVYVKYPYRKLGIAKMLLNKSVEKPLAFTHYTRSVEFMDKKYEWTYLLD